MAELRERSGNLVNIVRKVAALSTVVADLASTMSGEEAEYLVALSEVAEEFACRALADAVAISDTIEVEIRSTS